MSQEGIYLLFKALPVEWYSSKEISVRVGSTTNSAIRCLNRLVERNLLSVKIFKNECKNGRRTYNKFQIRKGEEI